MRSGLSSLSVPPFTSVKSAPPHDVASTGTLADSTPQHAPMVALVAIIVVGLTVRIWLATLPLGAFDGDEATTGVMVRQILHGHLYVYMAGQTYNGALEQYLQAGFWLIAPHSIWTLRAVDFAISAVTAVVVYKTATQYSNSRWRPVVAVGVYYLGPYFNVWKSIHSHGAYAVGQLIAALALYCASRLTGTSRDRYRDCFSLGLMVGLATWLSWTSFLLVLPAVLWAIPTTRNAPSRIPSTVAGAILGAGPAILWSISHHRLPHLGGAQPATSVDDRLNNLFGPIIREMLGVGYRYGKPGLYPWLQTLIVVLLLVTVIWYGASRRRALLGMLTATTQHRRPSDVLLLIPPVVVLAYAASRYSWWTGDPRYLFALFPSLGLAIAAVPVRGRSRRMLAGAAAVLLSATSTAATIAAHANQGPHQESACLSQVATYLEDRGITRVYSDYWTGMPLQLIAGNKLVVGPVSGGSAKFPYQRRLVDAAPAIYYLAGHIRDPMDEEQDDVTKVRNALAAHHVTARETPIACTVLFSHFRPEVRPWQIGVGIP